VLETCTITAATNPLRYRSLIESHPVSVAEREHHFLPPNYSSVDELKMRERNKDSVTRRSSVCVDGGVLIYRAIVRRRWLDVFALWLDCSVSFMLATIAGTATGRT